jgi:ABC-type Na+ transport system ATPase subunit NatA
MCQKMAIAQALLPSPGLLALDEAWTGLGLTDFQRPDSAGAGKRGARNRSG